MNKTLPFEVVFSENDFLVSMDDLDKVSESTECFINGEQEIVFTKNGVDTGYKTHKIPPACREIMNTSPSILFACFNRDGTDTGYTSLNLAVSTCTTPKLE